MEKQNFAAAKVTDPCNRAIVSRGKEQLLNNATRCNRAGDALKSSEE